jgi:hypothetical protein
MSEDVDVDADDSHKFITSHFNIFNILSLQLFIENKQYARFFIPTSKLKIFMMKKCAQ